ncbi:MAG TPA: succinate dehydrogenase assembly factor 2, partial [Xanthobacteraceae bacterium]|nr:succinate dehydrogenase assembly factor 2 [Xanthobacteraceae bacterium]
FRAWHRGTREMDLLLGRFTEKVINDLTDEQVALLERLMELPDPDIYNWIVGVAPVPPEYDTLILHEIRGFHLGKGGDHE